MTNIQTIDQAKSYYAEHVYKGEHDPKIFISKILSPADWRNPITGDVQEMEPNDAQLRWMLNSFKPYNNWAAGNSSGKSFGAAFDANWWAFYKKKLNKKYRSLEEFREQPYKVLLTGPESKQVMSLFEQVEFQLVNSPYLSQRIVNITTGTKRDPHPKIQLKYNTSIHAISAKNKGKSIESGDYDLIIFDEPADEPHLEYVIDKVLVARMFRRGGVLKLVGTPKDSPRFFDQYKRGAPEDDEFHDPRYYDPANYFSMNSSSFENPFADQEAIQRYANSKDPEIIQERLYGKFVSFSESAFPANVIEQCLDPDLPLHIAPSNNRTYITGVDFGRKNDYTVAVTLDVTEVPYTMVHFGRWGGGSVSWEFIFNQLYSIFNEYRSEFFVDATSAGGDLQVDWLRGMGIYYKEFIYTPAKKVLLINNLQDLMARSKIRFGYQPEMRDELRFYPRDLQDKGYDTDCVMGLALAGLRAKDFVEVGEAYEY